jgi:hypothetical protein
MFSLELSRAISADRQRQIERALHQRRLLDSLALGTTQQAEDGQHPGGRATQPGSQCAPVLGQAR